MKLFKKKSLDNYTMKNGVHMVTVSEPTSVNTEQFNTIRTNIQFSNIDKELKSILLTSSTASEGKSTVAGNLAASFAKQGKRTLLVDVDLRRPTVQTTFNVNSTKGLTNLLTSQEVNLPDVVFETTVPNLFVIPSGPIPPNSSELIGSKRMMTLMEQLIKQVDIIIYDGPPLLSVTDSQILSTRVDGVVLVVRAGKTEKASVRTSVERVQKVHGNIIGTILNDLEEPTNGYYGYYK